MEYKVGDCVLLTDLVDPDTAEMGTIKFIEEDNEIKDLYWIYIRANKEELNINFDNIIISLRNKILRSFRKIMTLTSVL